MNIESTVIAQLLNKMREIAIKKSSVLHFDNDNAITDEDYVKLTRIIKDQFNIVQISLSFLRSTSSRSTRKTPAMLLVKLRAGLTLAVLFNIVRCKRDTCSMANIWLELV